MPTIGKEISHIANATLEEVKAFFFKYYAPDNAILAVTGHITFEETVTLAEKWFGPIPRRNVAPRSLPAEPRQTEERRLTVERNVPVDALFMAFHICERRHPDYYAFDMLSDLLTQRTFLPSGAASGTRETGIQQYRRLYIGQH